MLKKFFVALLATITGVWIAFGLMFLFVIMLGVAAGISGNETAKIEKNSILCLDLSGTVQERTDDDSMLQSLLGLAGQQNSVQGLNTIVKAIRHAADNDNIDGIYIKADGAACGMATNAAIAQALRDFKKSGKWIYAYGDSYTQGNYLIAACADSIIVNPMGGIDLHGLAITTQFYKNLLDKLGIEMQIIKVGTYKSAVEPYIATDLSDANREQQTLFLNQIWDYFTEKVATDRSVEPAQVRLWADSLTVTMASGQLVEKGIADRLAYRHQAEASLKEMTGRDADQDLRLISPAEYVQAAGIKNKGSKEIALLYCVGEISDSGDEGIVCYDVVDQIQDLIDDDNNAALVMRVNSPGGSAFASEQIWEALQRYKQTGRPFYVSMGDYAASGGYYISCGADKIFAQPVTLTGSIGIFGMIPCVKSLLNDHLGITEGTVATSPNADFISLTKPLTPVQRAKMQAMINRGYETFVGRCAEGRSMSVDQIKAIAEGRVWTGIEAIKIGLVDELADLTSVVDEMKANLGGGEYRVVEYPNSTDKLFKRLKALGNISQQISLKAFGIDNSMLQMQRKAQQICSMNPMQARIANMTIE